MKTLIASIILVLIICSAIYCFAEEQKSFIVKDDKTIFSEVIEQYFNAYMKADIDLLLSSLHPKGPMYPEKGAIKNLRETAKGNSVPGYAKVTDLVIISKSFDSAQVKVKLFMKADVYGTGNYKEEQSSLVCTMKKNDGKWKLYEAKK